jgi:hypothetical protein
MPTFADRISTMPTDELLKEIQHTKQKYNESIDAYDTTFNNWMNNNHELHETICNLLATNINLLHRKLEMGMKERHRRQIQVVKMDI